MRLARRGPHPDKVKNHDTQGRGSREARSDGTRKILGADARRSSPNPLENGGCNGKDGHRMRQAVRRPERHDTRTGGDLDRRCRYRRSVELGRSPRRSESRRSKRPDCVPRLHRHPRPSLHRRLELGAANVAMLACQGAGGSLLCPAVHALRLHDASRHGYVGSRVADHQSARRYRQRNCAGAAHYRRSPHDQCDRGARRHAGHVSVPMPYGTIQGRGTRRREFASSSAWSTPSAPTGSRP